MGVELTSIGLQVHGGVGFIEETGAAQHFRDADCAGYEGTNGFRRLTSQAANLGFARVGSCGIISARSLTPSLRSRGLMACRWSATPLRRSRR